MNSQVSAVSKIIVNCNTEYMYKQDKNCPACRFIFKNGRTAHHRGSDECLKELKRRMDILENKTAEKMESYRREHEKMLDEMKKLI